MKKLAPIKTRIRHSGGGGIFHDSRADVNTLRVVIAELIEKQNEVIETVNKLIDMQNKVE